MFSITKSYEKTVNALLTGVAYVRTGVYTFPQFGTKPMKDKAKGEKYNEDDALSIFQEALGYFGPDSFVRHLNDSIRQRVQRQSNSDLRSGVAGLNELDSAIVSVIMTNARRAAEMEVDVIGEDGKHVPVNRKSPEYLAAYRSELEYNLNKPKAKHLRSLFTDAVSSSVSFDLMSPGSMSDEVMESVEATADETTPSVEGAPEVETESAS